MNRYDPVVEYEQTFHILYDDERNAIKKAFDSKQVEYDPAIVKSVDKLISLTYTNVPVSVETIQDYVERVLMQFGYYDIAKTFILYREQRKSTRFVKGFFYRISYFF